MFSNAWFTTSFIAASCESGRLDSRSAASPTSASSRSNGTALLIRPTAAASAPDSGLPVSACSFARVSPSLYIHIPVR